MSTFRDRFRLERDFKEIGRRFQGQKRGKKHPKVREKKEDGR